MGEGEATESAAAQDDQIRVKCSDDVGYADAVVASGVLDCCRNCGIAALRH